MATYLAEYADELRQLGDYAFRARYTTPMLVVQSFSGTLTDTSAKTGTVVSAKPLEDSVQASRLVGRVFPVRKAPLSPPGPISVGRTADNDIAVPEFSMSKRHCLIRVDAVPGGGTGAMLTDLGSTNGTLLDGTPAPAKKAVPLRDGGVLTMGRFTFAFVLPHSFVQLVKQQG